MALDVGGGFGTKGHIYPEDLLVPFLARLVGRPVRWIEERQEHLLCSCHSRDQLHEVEVGFDSEGHVLAFRDTFLVDCGAWNPIGVAIAYNTAVHLLGPYRIANFAATARIVATNKVPNAPYRGAGRPEAAFAMERTMDLIAQTLGLEPTEVRRRNMIHPKELPCAMGLPYRDGEPIVYDSGDFPGAMDKALQAIGGLAAFRERQREARRLGRCLGLGVASYVEGTGVGPFESALVRIESNGSITVSSGACSQGQGMETIFAQVVADLWSVDPHDVAIALGDTSLIAIGFGTIASRSTVNLSAAIHYASERLRAKVFAIAGNMMECAPADLELRRGKVGVVGAPGMEVTPRRRGAGAPVPDGIIAVRRASMPASRRPSTGSRPRSPGRTPPISPWSRWTSPRAASPSTATSWRTTAAWSSIPCWSTARSSAARCRAWAAPCSRNWSTTGRGSC